MLIVALLDKAQPVCRAMLNRSAYAAELCYVQRAVQKQRGGIDARVSEGDLKIIPLSLYAETGRGFLNPITKVK